MLNVLIAVLIVFGIFLLASTLTVYVLVLINKNKHKTDRFYLLSEDCQRYDAQQYKF